MPKERFDISLEDLTTFLAVADHGGFTRAADRLALSQPAVSSRVRRLEEKVGVRLLTRTTRKVELTPHGRRLHERATVSLRGLSDLLREFSGEADRRLHRVEVAATAMIAAVALAPILGGFAEAHAKIDVRLSDRLPEAALAAVAAGRCDMAVMVLERPQPGLAFEPLVADRCVVVTPLGHPLLARKPACLADVLAYAILSPDGHVGLRRAIEAAAAVRGLEPILSVPARGVTNVTTLLAMAGAGLGVCIHPSMLIPPELRPTIGLVEIADCEIVRTIGIVTATEQSLSPAARLFRDYLRGAMQLARSGNRTAGLG